jgi:hypothetical protein
MRCVFHSEHVENADAGWVSRVVEVVTQFPLDRAVGAGATNVGLRRTAHDDSLTLVSWVIAPVIRS